MRYFVALRAALSIILANGTPTACQEKKTDEQQMQGRWITVSANTGDPNLDQQFLGAIVKIDGHTLQSFNKAGESEGLCTFKLDTKKTPKQIDIITTSRDQKIITPGIYAIDKDELKWCWSSRRDGSVRPKDFTQAGGDEQFRSFVLRRVKPKNP